MNKKNDYIGENKMVRILKERLLNIKNNPFENIWINKKLYKNNKIKEEFEKKYGYEPILQPEIDFIFRTSNNELNAIEVKYLKKKNSGYNFSYYFGIGQALSLKRFGFDHVGLWLLLDENIPKQETNRYGSTAWSFIRNDLKLNLEYSYFKIAKNVNNKYDFAVMQYLEEGSGKKLVRDIGSKNFKITWKYYNEIRCFEKPKFMRYLIEKYICI